MTGQARALAQRTVTGVIAGMVVATAAATMVGFWLSYDGLHEFALRAGLRGPEAWAWPASVDLFILAGEAGVTIAALRRDRDRAAWCYLGLGFAASVTANVLHVDPGVLHWTRYAVAAVPPVAAMLALAALLRQVYRVAESGHASAGVPVRGQRPGPVRGAQGGPVRQPRTDRSVRRATDADAERVFAAQIAAGQVPSLYQIRSQLHVGNDRAKTLRQHIARLALST
jgi:hypothetical protein